MIDKETLKHLQAAWYNMNYRCYRMRGHEAKWWREKGIEVCEEWRQSKETFIEWAISNGYEIGLCLDRIDADGNYEPANCQWLTRSENTRKANEQQKINIQASKKERRRRHEERNSCAQPGADRGHRARY